MKVDFKCVMEPDGEHVSIHETWPHQTIKTTYKLKDEMINRQLEYNFITKERSLDEAVSLIEDILDVNGMEIIPYLEQLEIKKRDESCGIIRDWL